MIVLLAVALVTGIVTAVILSPFGVLTAFLAAPLAASSAAALVGLLMAARIARHDRHKRALDVQTGAMVAALRDVAHKAKPTSPAPKVAQRRRGT